MKRQAASGDRTDAREYTREEMRDACRNNYAAGRVAGLREAALWLEDAADHIYGEQHTSDWLRGAVRFLNQLADEEGAAVSGDRTEAG